MEKEGVFAVNSFRLAVAFALVGSIPAFGVNWIWPSVGSDMAGGTFTVWFVEEPPGSDVVGPFAAPILVVGPPPETGSAFVEIEGLRVTLTVTGDTFITNWSIENGIQDISWVIIDLRGSPAAFDDGGFLSTPFSGAGRPYTFVPNDDFADDPVADAIFDEDPLKDLGDMHRMLSLVFLPDAFPYAFAGSPQIDCAEQWRSTSDEA